MNIRHPPPHRRQPRRLLAWRGARGLTLVELLMGLLLMSVVLTIAAPGFQNFTKRTRVDLQITDLRSAMDYARAESLRRGVRVVVCSVLKVNAAAGAACSQGRNAWGPSRNVMVFVDNVHVAGNIVGKVDGDDIMLRLWEPPEDADQSTVYAFANWIAFTPQGRVISDKTSGVWGGIKICQAPYGRQLVLNSIGRLAENEVTC